MNHKTSPSPESTLKRLRGLAPTRDCTFAESLVIAERQATRLAALVTGDAGSVDGIQTHHIDGLPRIRVVFEAALPVSGMSHWNGQEWVITIAASDSLARQRFTMLHEFKHVIDHGATRRLYRGDRRHTTEERAEMAADYFAGCALVSKRDLKHAWGYGIQRPADLAAHFNVSEPAIRVRLAQTGLDAITDRKPTPRCARPVRGPRTEPQAFHYANAGYSGSNRRSHA